MYRYQNEARDIRYLTLARAQVEPIGKPADDVVDAADRRVDFRVVGCEGG